MDLNHDATIQNFYKERISDEHFIQSSFETTEKVLMLKNLNFVNFIYDNFGINVFSIY